MKMSLDWHKECHANSARTLEGDRVALARQAERFARSEREHARRAAQIAEAERRGLDGFDADRLLKPKGEPMSDRIADLAATAADAMKAFKRTLREIGDRARAELSFEDQHRLRLALDATGIDDFETVAGSLARPPKPVKPEPPAWAKAKGWEINGRRPIEHGGITFRGFTTLGWAGSNRAGVLASDDGEIIISVDGAFHRVNVRGITLPKKFKTETNAARAAIKALQGKPKSSR